MEYSLDNTGPAAGQSIDYQRLQITSVTAQHIFLPTEAGFQLGSPYEAQVFQDGSWLYSLRDLDQQAADRAPSDWPTIRNR